MGKKKKQPPSDIRVQFLGVDDEVTGSCTLIEVDGLKILLDLGGFQSQIHSKETIYKTNRRKLEMIPFDEIDYIILSSAHYDHCGSLGIIGRKDVNFNGVAICTELSQELIALNVKDCAYIMETECEAYNKNHKTQLTPLFTTQEASDSLGYLRGYGYDKKVRLNDRVYIEFLPNGHLSGDGSIYLVYEKGEFEKKRVLYTGDFNYGKEKAFTKKWNRENLKVDLLITESTYAGEIQPKSSPIDDLEKAIISECIEKKQVLILPSFAIHRSTEIAYMLKVIHDRNKIIRDADIPIYFAGVMMAKSHRIIGNPKYKDFYDEEWQCLEDLFSWDKLRPIESFQQVEKKLTDNKCKIMVISGGMLSGGYSKYVASMLIGRKTTSVLFSGYQGEGTVGRKIFDRIHKSVTIDGVARGINANVLGKLEGLSGHASGEQILKFIRDLNQRTLKTVVIIHGVDSRKQVLKEQLENVFKDDVNVIIPKVQEIVKI